MISNGVDLTRADTLQQASSILARHHGMVVRHTLLFEWDDEGEPTRAYLFLTDKPDVGEIASQGQLLSEHTEWVRADAKRIIDGLKLDPLAAEAVVLAAKWHDRGKDREHWQRGIGNDNPSVPLAKSAPGAAGERGFVGNYRHEFGSIRDAERDEALAAHPERDLILHLIAVHHGYGRPHFRSDQWDTPARRRKDCRRRRAEVCPPTAPLRTLGPRLA